MPVLQFKGKTAIECYHHTVPHHTLEFDSKLPVLGKGEKPGLDGNLIIEGEKLIALCMTTRFSSFTFALIGYCK